tara:strand:- start:1563 stop:2075 length:513 start_codon:yes stop_codon:yes gene_type:complete
MHIIFGNVNSWQLPLIKLLSYFKFKIYYLLIDSGPKLQRNEIANELKKRNITPLPLEFEKKISKNLYSVISEDTNEVAYKKNLKMIPDTILKKYCNLFSINKKDVKKLRLLIQDIVAGQQRLLSGRIGIWSNLKVKQLGAFTFQYKLNFLRKHINFGKDNTLNQTLKTIF